MELSRFIKSRIDLLKVCKFVKLTEEMLARHYVDKKDVRKNTKKTREMFARQSFPLQTTSR